jgi:hypothetical protein
VAKVLLEGTPSLSLLSFWPDLTIHKVGNLPSWVPDFSRHFDDDNPNLRIYAHEQGIDFNAADIKHEFVEVRKVEGRRLRLRGCRIDTIQRCAAPIRGAGEDWAMFESMLKLIFEMDLKYRNGQDRLEALWRTIGWDSHRFKTPAENEKDFRMYILGSLQFKVYRMAAFEDYSDGSYKGVKDPRQVVREQAAAHIRVLRLCEKVSKDSTVRLPSLEEYNDWVTRFVNAYCHADDAKAQEDAITKFSWEAVKNQMSAGSLYYARSSRLFRGSNGYLGLGPAPIVLGDEVWILENSRMPFILRQAEDGEEGEQQFRLLGEAYVHGIMRRELFLDKREDEKPKFEELIIV